MKKRNKVRNRIKADAFEVIAFLALFLLASFMLFTILDIGGITGLTIFTSNATTFPSGTFNQTRLNESNYVQLNISGNITGDYFSPIFGTSTNKSWDNLTISPVNSFIPI